MLPNPAATKLALQLVPVSEMFVRVLEYLMKDMAHEDLMAMSAEQLIEELAEVNIVRVLGSCPPILIPSKA